jgi:DNA-binding CsgD family transcriptional regulator
MYPVVMIIAPAGFGKTTAIRQLLAYCAAPISISVPSATANLHQFMQAFARACADRFPSMKEPPDEFSASAPVEKVVELYATWAIAHLRDVHNVIAIDDLQNLPAGVGTPEFLIRLIEGCKPQLQLILASRNSENLPYVQWQAYGDATAAITADDLRMTLEEATELAQRVHSVATVAQLRSWVEQTEGFPIPLSFAIRASTTHDNNRDIMKGARSLTFDFLIEHFWKSLGNDERSLLELASVLPPIHLHDYASAPIVNAVEKLNTLSQQIAFVTLNSDHFFVHDLLRDFIYQELLKKDPAVLKNIYRRAIELLFAAKRFSQAFDVLLKSGDLQALYDNVEKYPPPSTNLNLNTQLVDASTGCELSDMGLAMLVVQIEYAGRTGDAARGIRAAEEIIRRDSARSTHLLCAFIAISRFSQHHSEAQRIRCRERMMRLLDKLEDKHLIQAKAHYAFYISRFSDSAEASRLLGNEVQLDLHHLDLERRFEVQNTLALMMFYLGDSRAAAHLSKEAYESAKAIGNNIGVAQALNTLGIMLLDLCDPEVVPISRLLLPVVEKTGAWRFSYVSHMYMSWYYAREGNAAMSLEASALQQKAILVDPAEIEQASYFSRMCTHLRNLIDENYREIILDYEDAILPKTLGAAYHIFTILGIAYAFSGFRSDAERTLLKARSEREKLVSAWEQRLIVDVTILEVIALGFIGKWNQARLLIRDEPLATQAVRSLTSALRLFTDGPPFSGVMSALEQCFKKPYVGLGAILISRAVDQLEKTPQRFTLSPSEHEVLRMICLGKSNKQIATSRGRSAETVKRQVATLFRKLNVENRTSAMLVAREHGLI